MRSPLVFGCLAAVLDAIEAERAWPDQLLASCGVLLSKGKCQGVMDQRVIGLLPRVVRAWSRTRRHPDAYAEAMIHLKQAYERIDHGALAVALVGSPLPAPVAALLLQVYTAPRSLRSAGATSPWLAPRSGIVAACSLADIALRCVMEGPANDVAPVVPRVTTRAYADDVKLSARGRRPR